MYYLCSKLIYCNNIMRTFEKRFCLVLTCALLSLHSVFAGSDILRWGITAGANITKVDGEGSGFNYMGWHYDSSGGYFVGVTARLSLPILNFGLDASLTYAQEMADLESNGATATEKLRYFSVPVHVRYDFELPVLSNVLVPYAFAGPQCNFALNEFDTYHLFSQDPGSADDIYHIGDEAGTSKRVWKFDLGFGMIVFNHIQLSYFYAIPLGSSFRFKTAYDDSRSHFRMGTHHIGLAYYF